MTTKRSILQIKKDTFSIQEICNLTPIFEILKLINHHDLLVIFDIDDVLIAPDNDNDFKHPFRADLWCKLKNKLSAEKIKLLHSKIFVSIKWQLIDDKIMKLLSYLKTKNISSIGLTATGTGKFGVIEQMENFRINSLNKLNISFLPLTPLDGQAIAVELKNSKLIFENCEGIPMLQEGIIFTAGIDKGIALQYMLNKFNYYPKTIIFIDDLLENIKSLKKLCIKLKINFYGLHYVVKSFDLMPNIDVDLETLRFKLLEEQEYWLDYKQLKKLI